MQKKQVDMMSLFGEKIATEQALLPGQAETVLKLLDEGATIPFIARYRKEATGNLDEVAITAIRDRARQLKELEERKKTILKSLEKTGNLSPELEKAVKDAQVLSELEDLYLPYKPKRRTRGMMAKEKGLAPLAELIFRQEGSDPFGEAKSFLDEEKGVDSVEDALKGARDIIAEWINEDAFARSKIRRLFLSEGIVKSSVIQGMEETGSNFRDYFDYSEPINQMPSHRLLAMRRGEKTGVLTLFFGPREDRAIELLTEIFVKGELEDSAQVKMAVSDAYRRLLGPSIETEIRVETKRRADTEAIRIFASNLRQLLMAPPLGRKRVMAVDPGFRTGSKVACLDRQGKLLHHETLFFHRNEREDRRCLNRIEELVRDFEIDAVAVGNGTAGRETERLLAGRLNIPVVMVDESGASVYSASEVARKEFPDLDVTVRGAVSIGRRLMDPLAELVKIDPKAIGVGQYQHDVDQGALKEALDDVVKSCVNSVGVDINRASPQLLGYVSGLGPTLAKNIVEYRDTHGPFAEKMELLSVPRIGPKAFEQASGFLRIIGGKNPLDASAVHPERYSLVTRMAEDLGYSVADLIKKKELLSQIDLKSYVDEGTGIFTLRDILMELEKPGRDPRDEFVPFNFADDVSSIEDLSPGMKLPGIVTNITAFGAFVDIGVHVDGLVHKSRMSDEYVTDPSSVVKLRQRVKVEVLSVDRERKRISLAMQPGKKKGNRKPKQAGNPFRDALAGLYKGK